MRGLGLLMFAAVAGCTTPNPVVEDLAMKDMSIAFPVGCMSGAKDGDETDVDCGGSCAPCGAGLMCKRGNDCDSGSCTNQVCDGPSCSDGKKNGDETDVDCGGVTCSKCSDGKACNLGTDCQSGTCNNNVCKPSPCSNGVKDGAETDVDCGGGSCTACTDGKTCLLASDCKGGRCSNGKCESAPNCAQGTADCDGNQQNGCEVNLTTDAANCGKCRNACQGMTPLCAASMCRAAPKILIAIAENGQQPAGGLIKSAIKDTGIFSDITVLDASVRTLQAADLMPYEVVLVVAVSSFKDRVALGDALATYYDQGGRVVMSALADVDEGIAPGGRWGDPANGYLLVVPGGRTSSPDSLGKLLEPQSSLLKGVVQFKADRAYRATVAPAMGSVIVAEWKSGTPLIVRGTVKGRKRVDLNLPPIPDTWDPGLWTGDGAALIRNALLYQ